MNDYVTVDRVKMTKLYPEGGAEAPPVADAAKFAGGPAVRPHASGHQNMLPASFSRFARALLILCPLKQKKEGYTKVYPSFLERATRLELATSTLARSRSTR